MLLVVLLAGAGVIARDARAADPTDDVPSLPPLHSTGFVCALPNAHKLIVSVVVSYSSGETVRFDAQHMHGFTLLQLMRYHDSAADNYLYVVPCKETDEL